MVNRIVFDYLSKYHGQYNLEDLKKKILSAGYPQQDVDEAVKLLGLEESSNAPRTDSSTNVAVSTANLGTTNTFNALSISSSPVQSNFGSSKPVGKKFKWMKFAGILGIIYLLIGILLGVFSYLKYLDFTSSIILYSLIGVFGIMFISIFFFIYGFVVMGKYGDSGLLRFASKSYIILIILGILIGVVTGVVIVFMLGEVITEFGNILTGAGGNPLLLFSSFGGFGEIIAKYALMVISLATLAGFWMLFFIVASFCFFIGLMQAGNEIKFAKIAGLFGILALIIFFAFILLFSGVATFSSEMLSGGDFGLVVTIGIISILALIGFCYIFMVISLFKGSRKFESGYI